MLTVSNALSFARAPLAFFLLHENSAIRLIAIFLAMATDGIDGYLARKNLAVTRLGTILDPAMDKFFVSFALAIFYFEGRISALEALAMLSRDGFLLLYGFLMVGLGRWKEITLRAIRWGKVTTALQFLALLALAAHFPLPWIVFPAFLAMGGLAFWELFRFRPISV